MGVYEHGFHPTCDRIFMSKNISPPYLSYPKSPGRVRRGTVAVRLTSPFTPCETRRYRSRQCAQGRDPIMVYNKTPTSLQ